MASLIKGITVTLYETTKRGVDAFNAPIYEETAVEVENVLVSPVSAESVMEGIQFHGKKEIYELCIPKGDTHEWKDKRVAFFGREFKTFGAPVEYIEGNLPLDWNKKVKVERYE